MSASTAIGRETRRRIVEVLEPQEGTLSLVELHDALSDLAPKEVGNGLMQLVRTGVVHSTGTVRAGEPPAYELWEHVTRRMQRARRRAEPKNPVALAGRRAFNARRIA